MRNSVFNIKFDEQNGGITSIRLVDDRHHMNWVDEGKTWGIIRSKNYAGIWGEYEKRCKNMELAELKKDETMAISKYTNGVLSVTVERFFSNKGNFVERYTLKNISDVDLFLEQDNFGILLPFADRYTDAEDCMINRCHTHIWCGHNTAYINALKMGVSDTNIGLVLKTGAIDSYSILGADSTRGNYRGEFMLNLAHTELMPGEEYVLEWEIFETTGTEDFYKKIQAYDSYIGIKAEHLTVFDGENIKFEISSQKSVCVGLDGKNIAVKCSKVEYSPQRLGKHRFWIEAEGVRTYADFNVVMPLKEIVEKRIEFILNKQQYLRKGSVLDGAFLAYDNIENHVVFNDQISDHNACRERIGMALLLTKFLQENDSIKHKQALEKYIQFLYREFFDSGSGAVYNSVSTAKKEIRLYNAPWVSMLLTELYTLTQEKKYLSDVLAILEFYYENGGARFYPNGFSFVKTYEAFKYAEMKTEAERVLELFTVHAKNIVANGTDYPKHEVNYEQTIVSPAATLISEMGVITGEDVYKSEAKKHIEVLERFNGHQPSFHLNEIPIRYWDDFWFGKRRIFGDTFPHYWSCLTARAYNDYYVISCEEKYKYAAEECLRNCLCLFDIEGRGSCAYVYPYMINGERCEFYDDWANDQDFALYFALEMEMMNNI